jgi:lactoylglutathione lyase
MIKFAYTILYVRDVARTISFYEKAFGFTKKFITPGNEYGELGTGETTLSFATIELAESNLPEGFIKSDATKKPFGMEISFTTDDVNSAYNAALKAGASAVQGAKEKPWGQTVAYVRDPEGFLIELCTPME